MRRVIICSPYRGDVARNNRYLDACLRDSYARGESPYASHALGPRVLEEDIPEDRERGLRAGLAWIERADALAVYCDLGGSQGMQREIDAAYDLGIPIEHRRLGGEWAKPCPGPGRPKLAPEIPERLRVYLEPAQRAIAEVCAMARVPAALRLHCDPSRWPEDDGPLRIEDLPAIWWLDTREPHGAVTCISAEGDQATCYPGREEEGR